MRRVSEQKVSGGFAPIFASICSRFYKENVLIGDVARYPFYFYCLLLQKCRRFFVYFCCRTPQGVRGLKLDDCGVFSDPAEESHPARGAWIEIIALVVFLLLVFLSHPARGAWIEIVHQSPPDILTRPSHPARGAWIEIWICLQTGGFLGCRTPQGVRGLKLWYQILSYSNQHRSHPARGAWIEILIATLRMPMILVAPRKGCVD